MPSIKKKQTAADAVIIPDGRDDLGTSEHSVHAIMEDARSRYFHDRDELYDYAEKVTEDIGYVDREKTWVRLPDRFLVLGERHNGTTLPDLVEATGTRRYIYEAGARPSSYLRPDTYMVLEAKERGCRLAGVGDNHRRNLQGVFEVMDPDILVMK